MLIFLLRCHYLFSFHLCLFLLPFLPHYLFRPMLFQCCLSLPRHHYCLVCLLPVSSPLLPFPSTLCVLPLPTPQFSFLPLPNDPPLPIPLPFPTKPSHQPSHFHHLLSHHPPRTNPPISCPSLSHVVPSHVSTSSSSNTVTFYYSATLASVFASSARRAVSWNSCFILRNRSRNDLRRPEIQNFPRGIPVDLPCAHAMRAFICCWNPPCEFLPMPLGATSFSLHVSTFQLPFSPQFLPFTLLLPVPTLCSVLKVLLFLFSLNFLPKLLQSQTAPHSCSNLLLLLLPSHCLTFLICPSPLVLFTHSPDIICISETWLYPDILDSELAIHGYSLFHRDRNRGGGGVAMFIKCSLCPSPTLLNFFCAL